MEIVAKDYKDGKLIRVQVEKGYIISVSNAASLHSNEDNLFVAPGLVDLQINGYNGIDFNAPDVNSEKIIAAVSALQKDGVTSFFPTIITNSTEQIAFLLKAIVNARHNKNVIADTIAGIHLEGPFISWQDGPRGAHDENFIIPPNWELFCKWQDVAEGNIKMITLSPEWDSSETFIKACVQSGVKVAIGHTGANESQIAAAVSAGATLSTHLGNGTHLNLPRHPNYIWEQLANDRLWINMIADGFHLPDCVLKVFLKVKQQKSFLVSDATSFTNQPPGIYDAHIGNKVVLSKDKRLSLFNNPTMLAGSAKSLIGCVNHLVKANLLGLATALDLASLKPLQFLSGIHKDPFQINSPADLILFKIVNSEIEIVQTIKSGQIVFSKI